MRRMPSSSMRLPCSTDATPARTARLIASAPCAWAATFFPHIAASCTTALSSSCEYCGAPTDSSSDNTPALASTLIKYGADLIKVLASAGVELLLRVLRRAHRLLLRQHAGAGEHLDQVRAVLDLPADLAADLIHAVCNAGELLEPEVGREAVHVTVPPRRRQGHRRHQHPRPRHHSRV